MLSDAAKAIQEHMQNYVRSERARLLSDVIEAARLVESGRMTLPEFIRALEMVRDKQGDDAR